MFNDPIFGSVVIAAAASLNVIVNVMSLVALLSASRTAVVV